MIELGQFFRNIDSPEELLVYTFNHAKGFILRDGLWKHTDQGPIEPHHCNLFEKDGSAWTIQVKGPQVLVQKKIGDRQNRINRF